MGNVFATLADGMRPAPFSRQKRCARKDQEGKRAQTNTWQTLFETDARRKEITVRWLAGR